MHADASSWKIFVCLAKIAKSNSQLIIYTQTYHSGIKKGKIVYTQFAPVFLVSEFSLRYLLIFEDLILVLDFSS